MQNRINGDNLCVKMSYQNENFTTRKFFLVSWFVFFVSGSASVGVSKWANMSLMYDVYVCRRLEDRESEI